MNNNWYLIIVFIWTSCIFATPLNYRCDSSSYELNEALKSCWIDLKREWMIDTVIRPSRLDLERCILEYKPGEKGIFIELSSKNLMSYLTKQGIPFLGHVQPNVLLIMITSSGEPLDDHSLFSLWKAQAQSKGFELNLPLWDLNEQMTFNSKEINGIKSKELDHLFDHYDADLICLIRIHEQYIVIKSFNNHVIPEHRIKRDNLEELTDILEKSIHNHYNTLPIPNHYHFKAQRHRWDLKAIFHELKQIAEINDLHIISMSKNDFVFSFNSIWGLNSWKRFLKQYPATQLEIVSDATAP